MKIPQEFDTIRPWEPEDLPEVFDRPVELRHLLARDRRHGDVVLRPELFAQGFGNIHHLVKIGDAAVQPGEDLLAAERRFALRAQRRGDFLQCH